MENKIIKHALQSKEHCYLILVNEIWRLVSAQEFERLREKIPLAEELVYHKFNPASKALEITEHGIEKFLVGQIQIAHTGMLSYHKMLEEQYLRMIKQRKSY